MRGPVAVALGVVATLLGGLPLWLVAGLAPQLQEEFGFDETGLGTAVGVSFLVSAVAAVPAGHLVDRAGWSRGVAAAAGVSGVAMLTIALAARSWPVVVALLAAGSIAVSLSHPAANIGITRGVSAGRQGLAFGIKQASVPMTTLVAGLSAPLLGQSLGWRGIMTGAAVVALVFLGVVALHVPNEGAAPRPTPAAASARRRRAVRYAVPPLSVVVLATGAGFASAATVSLGGFLVLYAVASGFAQDEAGYLMALGSVAGIAGRVLSGYLADRLRWRHLVAVVVMMCGGAVGFAALAVGSTRWLIAAGTVLAFGLGWAWNGLFALAVVLRHPAAPGWATGVVQTALCLGATAGPPLFGVLVSRMSYAVAWSAAAGASLCGALLIVLALAFGGRGGPDRLASR